MSSLPKVCILTGVGINSHVELAECFDDAGASSEQVHVSLLEREPEKVLEYQAFAIPGGFSFGDHIASGRILANLLKYGLGDVLKEMKKRDMPILGICNGFQILVQLGLLPDLKGEMRREVSLMANDSAKYEDRWVELQVEGKAASKSPWLKNIESLKCPVRHGEGKCVSQTLEEFDHLEEQGLIALKYIKSGKVTMDYPDNPNGSWKATAGLIDPSGLVFGLMPHPEVAVWNWQGPNWTRGSTQAERHLAWNFSRTLSNI